MQKITIRSNDTLIETTDIKSAKELLEYLEKTLKIKKKPTPQSFSNWSPEEDQQIFNLIQMGKSYKDALKINQLKQNHTKQAIQKRFYDLKNNKILKYRVDNELLF
jgi:hypothetical protein